MTFMAKFHNSKFSSMYSSIFAAIYKIEFNYYIYIFFFSGQRGAGWPSGLGACLWIKRSEVRSPAATPCAAVNVVVQTVTYKLLKFISLLTAPSFG